MFGPGEYVPDPTEGIIDIQDLPRPHLVVYSRNHDHTPAHDVAIWPIATHPGSAPYTIWAICPLDVRWSCW
jgi:hypothetical protein